MESFIHLFETPGSGTQTARASMPECLPPEVNTEFLRPFYHYFCPLNKLLLSDLVQVEEGNVEYKVRLSQRVLVLLVICSFRTKALCNSHLRGKKLSLSNRLSLTFLILFIAARIRRTYVRLKRVFSC